MANRKSPAPPFCPHPDRSVELPVDEMHVRLEVAIEKLNPPRIRNACRNALNHLRKAWTLHPVDSEMSLFRAITAEEEAATAVIRALRLRAYPNAERLKDRQHFQQPQLKGAGPSPAEEKGDSIHFSVAQHRVRMTKMYTVPVFQAGRRASRPVRDRQGLIVS